MTTTKSKAAAEIDEALAADAERTDVDYSTDNEWVYMHHPDLGGEATATRRALRLVWGPQGYVEGKRSDEHAVYRNEAGVEVTDPADAVDPAPALALEIQAQGNAFNPTPTETPTAATPAPSA